MQRSSAFVWESFSMVVVEIDNTYKCRAQGNICKCEKNQIKIFQKFILESTTLITL